MASSGSSLRDTVFSLPIVDTHTHIIPWQDLGQPVTAFDLLNRSGSLRQAFVTSGALSRQEYRRMKRFPDWASLSGAIGTIRAAATWRIIFGGLRSLYDLECEELDEAAFEVLGERMSEAYKDPDWYSLVLRDRSRFSVICQDSGGQVDRALLTPVVRLDSYVLFGRPGFGERVVAKHGEERTATLDGLLGCLEQDFDEALNSGAAAIKSNNTWGRALNYEDVTTAAAEKAVALCRAGDRDERAEKALGDFMMGRIAALCGENNIPLQFHTGPAMGTDHYIDYGNPLHLNGLIMRNPDTRFMLLHTGGPFSAECCWLAQQFQNVYLDLSWVLCVQPLRRLLGDWLEYLPHNKLTWGTDVNLVEEAYAAALNFRTALACVLEDRVASGYLSIASAEDFARAILADNARRILRL